MAPHTQHNCINTVLTGFLSQAYALVTKIDRISAMDGKSTYKILNIGLKISLNLLIQCTLYKFLLIFYSSREGKRHNEA